MNHLFEYEYSTYEYFVQLYGKFRISSSASTQAPASTPAQARGRLRSSSCAATTASATRIASGAFGPAADGPPLGSSSPRVSFSL